MSGILLATVGNSYGSAPVNTVAPAVTGTATFGSTLTTTDGTWIGAPAPTFTYQWFRSPSTSISGATSTTYVLVAADVGFGIFCRVRATNSVAPSGVTADSNTTATVAAIVPGAPTIGTATATGVTTATVAYTAPASDGGATITTYTATSSPSGITGTLSQSGSGTITVTGLTGSTSYTFTVTATNSAGTSAASAASNSITTSAVTGQEEFTSHGTYTWVAPAGVTSVSAVCVGGGAGFGSGGGACGGGALAYANNISVTPSVGYTVVVGRGGFANNPTDRLGGTSSFKSPSVAAGGGQTPSGGTVIYGTGGSGGAGGSPVGDFDSGGGGAGGYSGNGGGGGAGGTGSNNGSAGSSGGGGGGGGGGGAMSFTAWESAGFPDGRVNRASGGGVGLLGAGSSGGGGAGGSSSVTPGAGGGGSSGSSGTSANNQAAGGAYGGGASGSSSGGSGAVRIIWPGTTRSFPSTNTGNL